MTIIKPAFYRVAPELIALAISLAGSLWLIKFGISLERAYRFDFSGRILVIGSSLLFFLIFWEGLLLLMCIYIEWSREILIGNGNLTVKKGSVEKHYSFKDLTEIHFKEKLLGSRSLTGSITYVKLIFKDTKLIITSVALSNSDAENLFKNTGIRKTRSDRRYFEFIN